MKLKEWAEKTGVKYLTAYRWFKAGTLPVKAYQTGSGTIIVEEELESERQEKKLMSNNVMSLFIKKTVEFSNDDSSIEDFAAWVLANFSLKYKDDLELPKYSKNKPKSEDIQKHFQQFIKPKGEKPKVNMFVIPEALDDLVAKADTLTDQELVNEIKKCGDEITPTLADPEISALLKDIHISDASVLTKNAEELVFRTVDLSTPQQINYTSSTDKLLGTSSNVSVNASGQYVNTYGSTFVTGDTNIMSQGNITGTVTANADGSVNVTSLSNLFTGPYYNPENLTLEEGEETSSDLWMATKFKPTQKELTGATKVLESAAPAVARRRGRKPKAKP